MRIEYKPEGTDNKTEENNNEHALAQGETVMKESLRQLQKMKDKPFKDRMAYYVNYYKWYVIGAVAIIGILSSVIHTMVTHKDLCFSAMMINANLYESTIDTDFGTYANLNLDEYDCLIDTTAKIGTSGAYYDDTATVAKMVANIQSQELDCIVCDSIRFENDAYNETYQDIKVLLSPEKIEKYEDDFYYIDMDVVRKEQEKDLELTAESLNEDKYDTTREKMEEALEYHRHPENMKEPIAVGIIVSDAPFIVNNDVYTLYIPVFGVIGNTTRPELAIEFLEYLYL